MREKCDKQRVIDEVSHGLHLSPIDIDGVGKTGKGVKADAYRENDLQDNRRLRHVKQSRQRACEEIVIFKETKNTEVN